MELGSRSGVKRILVRCLNPFIIGLGKIMNKRAFRLLFSVDHLLAHTFKTYRQLAFVIVKDPSAWADRKNPTVDVDAVLDFKVPPYVLR